MNNPVLYLSFLTGLIFLGCSHTSELTSNTLPENETDVDYSVTYYIHADSDYLYHTHDSKPVRDNSEILNTAFNVGETARTGEVFIFYQRPEKKLLGLFPQRDSRFYHYRNGQLINRVNYRHPDNKEAFLATEARLMNQYGALNRPDNHQNYFLYFGHEIPLETGYNYHQTLPGINVNTDSFAKGIQNFLLYEGDRFDLVILSACNNGTPAMAEHLMPFTDLMLASPQNLHLSHIDSDVISILENDPDTSPIQLARLMADQTFKRLTADIQTAITLALYDFEDVRPYINPLTSLTATNNIPDRSVKFQDNVDCEELLLPVAVNYSDGVKTWYKPARFGRQSGKRAHSGWGCKPSVKYNDK